MRRMPSPALVADANVLLGVALSLRPNADLTLYSVGESRQLLLTERAAEESSKVADDLARRGMTNAPHGVRKVLELFTVMERPFYELHLEAAAKTLRLAVASRNGSTADAHLLALAWATDSDIWSADRDFAGTGWPSWSTANLVQALITPDQEFAGRG